MNLFNMLKKKGQALAYLMLQYSANLKNHSDFSDLCDSLKLTMIDQNISPNCSIQNQNNQGIRS
jgi:5-carboxymethyl-2-hydroxymuconate isomerase